MTGTIHPKSTVRRCILQVYGVLTAKIKFTGGDCAYLERHGIGTMLLALYLPFGVHAALAANIVCPPLIVETPSVSTETKGWTSVAHAVERSLLSVGIHYGSILDHLELDALVPDAETSGKTEATATWKLVRDKDKKTMRARIE
jgi:hypothetical protein